MPNIIDEIERARLYLLHEGKECNTVIIPENRREEITNEVAKITWCEPSDPQAKQTVFGCEVLYSDDTDKIKVGYLK